MRRMKRTDWNPRKLLIACASVPDVVARLASSLVRQTADAREPAWRTGSLSDAGLEGRLMGLASAEHIQVRGPVRR